MKLLSHCYKKFTQWLLPYVCLLCGQRGDRLQDLCKACYLDLPFLTEVCLRCARPLAIPQALECGTCLTLKPAYDSTYALFSYQQPIVRLIMDLKFAGALTNARLLGELLANKMASLLPYPEAILPVPLHPHRIRERGFNQAVEMARPISRLLKIPLLLSSLIRNKHTQAQATLNAKERQENIRQAFKIRGPLPFQHIVILDDVITTGATANEISKLLKKAGVKRVDVWCCARATP